MMRHISFSVGITKPKYAQERRMRLHHNEKCQYPLILGKVLSGFILLSTIMPSYAFAASKVTYTPPAKPTMTVQQAKSIIEKISNVCQSNVSHKSDDCVIWPPNTANPDTPGSRVESLTFNKDKLNIAIEGGNYSFSWKGMHVTSGTFGYGSIFMMSYPVVFISGSILSLYDNDSSKLYRQVADAITVMAAEKRSELAADNLAFQKIAETYRNAKVKPVPGENIRKFVVMADEAVHQERFNDAVNDYEQGLKVAPWWPQGHFNAAMILGKLHVYGKAIEHMKQYLMLVPDAPNARAAQDQIYKWEADK